MASILSKKLFVLLIGSITLLSFILFFFSDEFIFKGGEQGIQPELLQTESSKELREECPDINIIIDRLTYSQPSWQELECYQPKVSRLPYHEKFFAIGIGSEAFGKTPDIPTLYFNTLEKYRQRFGFYNSNPSLSLITIAPPYVYDDTKEVLKAPLIRAPEYHDRKLRATIAMYIKQKLQYGHVFVFSGYYPPNQNIGTENKTLEEFKKWFIDVYLKEKAIEARVAEKWGFEYFNPLPVEIERWLTPSYLPGPLNGLSNEEIEELGQWVIDKAAEETRKYFNGKLILSRYPFYKHRPDMSLSPEPNWETLDMRNYDLVGFSLIPECDLETTKRFAEEQLNYYAKLSAQQNIPWGLGELDVWEERYTICGQNFERVEPLIWQELLNILRKTDPQPSFALFFVRNQVNPVNINTEAFNLILNYTKSR